MWKFIIFKIKINFLLSVKFCWISHHFIYSPPTHIIYICFFNLCDIFPLSLNLSLHIFTIYIHVVLLRGGVQMNNKRIHVTTLQFATLSTRNFLSHSAQWFGKLIKRFFWMFIDDEKSVANFYESINRWFLSKREKILL